MAKIGVNVFPRAPEQGDLRTQRALRQLAISSLSAQGGQATNLLISDDFNDVNGTSLSAHAMNQGLGWVQQASAGTQALIRGGSNWVEFGQSGHGGNMIWTTQTAGANITGTVVINYPASGIPDNSDAGFIFRYKDLNNYNFVSVGQGIGGFAIYEVVGGVFQQRAFAALAVLTDTDYTIKAVVAGAKAIATLNGAYQIEYDTLTVNTSGTIHGIRAGGGDPFSTIIAKGTYTITNP